MTEQQIKELANRLAKDAFVIKRWCKKHKCEDCVLYPNYPNCTVSSIFGTSPNVWEIEPEVTDYDKVVLRKLSTKYKWIACDKGGGIWAYESKPSKGEFLWRAGEETGKVLDKDMLPNLFRWCTWEDDEPWYIPDLLG